MNAKQNKQCPYCKGTGKLKVGTLICYPYFTSEKCLACKGTGELK